jgi:hypothetical protein
MGALDYLRELRGDIDGVRFALGVELQIQVRAVALGRIAGAAARGVTALALGFGDSSVPMFGNHRHRFFISAVSNLLF